MLASNDELSEPNECENIEEHGNLTDWRFYVSDLNDMLIAPISMNFF